MTRKIFILTIVFASFATLSRAQNISINADGTSPDNSAMLDVQSTNSGVLVPRMTMAQRDAITNPATGLLLFQTDNGQGFYYNSGTPGSPVWTLIGSGVSAGNFIGDADNDTKIQVEETGDEDIIRFDMGGLEYFTMDSGKIGVFNTGSSVYMGANAGLKDDLSLTRGNVGYGTNALKESIGASNSAFGFNALRDNTGNSSTAIGAWSFNSNIGGVRNVGLGASAGFGNLAGSNNVFIGWQSGSSNTGSNNVFLGSEAGRNYTGSDKLYIENSNSNKPLIYGNFLNDSLIIHGNLKLDSAKDGSGYTFPGLDGNLNQVLRTDGSGQLFWSNEGTTTQWTTGGQTLYPSSTNNRLSVGGTSVQSNFRMQINAGAGSITKGLYISNTANAGANDKIGLEILLDAASSQRKYGIISKIIGTPGQADSLIGIHNILMPDNNATLPFSVGFRSSYIGSDGETYGVWLEGEKYNYMEGNLGIGVANPTALLELDNAINSRKISLFTMADNDHQFLGFGTAFGEMRYQVDQITTDHVFYAGTSAASSAELVRITGDGKLGIQDSNPDGTLSINGTLQYKISTLDIGTDDQIDDLAIPADALVIRITGPDNNADITGIAASFDGRVIEIINASAHDVTLKADDINSLAANRIYTRNNGDRNIRQYSFARLIYSTADAHWIVIGGDF